MGEPFRLTLDIAHPADARPFVQGTDLGLDESWVEFATAREAPVVDEADGARTRIVWTLASLEPGLRALDLPFPTVGGPLEIEVAGVLGPDEDAPRPQQGFRPIPGEEEAGSSFLARVAWVAASALGVALVGLPFLVVAARRRPRRPPAPAPLDRLAALQERASKPRPACFELSLLVRESLDERTGRDRCGLTDAEWLEVLESDGRVPAAAKVAAGAVLERCGTVKYGRHVPTAWALEETFEEARRALVTTTGNGEGES